MEKWIIAKDVCVIKEIYAETQVLLFSSERVKQDYNMQGYRPLYLSGCNNVFAIVKKAKGEYSNGK